MQSIRFFIMMLPTFLARVSPASTRAKPACMKNTRTPAMSTQMLSRMTWLATPSGMSCAYAGAAMASTTAPLIAGMASSFRLT